MFYEGSSMGSGRMEAMTEPQKGKRVNNLKKIKEDLRRLLVDGQSLAIAWAVQYKPSALGQTKFKEEERQLYSTMPIGFEYQKWYSEALQVVKFLIPNRLQDFRTFYEFEGNRKSLSYINYRIADCFRGVVISSVSYDDMMGFCLGMLEHQRSILMSAWNRLDSSLYEIQQVLQADLFDSEIDAAKELNKKGFSRAAGAMVGVVLEKHLETVIKAHALTLGKKNPCINDYNQKLKDEGVLDVPTWRFVQRLGDLRNLCDHNKSADPKREDIDELIAGVDKIMKTVA